MTDANDHRQKPVPGVPATPTQVGDKEPACEHAAAPETAEKKQVTPADRQ